MYHMYDVNLDFTISNVQGCDSMFVEFEASMHCFASPSFLAMSSFYAVPVLRGLSSSIHFV